MKRGISLIGVLVCLGTFLIGQEQYGNIRGKVTDSEGAPLPGVSIILECSLFVPRSTQTSENGAFRFLNITPGIYSFKCQLPGFKTHVQENVNIRVGTNFDFPIVLEPSVLEESITIVAESPIVDTKKTGTGANVTQVMLQEIPSARDPWVILQQLPGIQLSNENVGGGESGQQPWFMSRGRDSSSAIYNLDGMPITDMAALGSPAYYDFDTFEEMQIVTGGGDASIQTSGVSINFVTRRGGNRFQGMGRFFFTNDDLQGDNRTQELIDLEYVGNQISRIMDYGFQFGGPILRDKIWFWFGYGVQDIRTLTISGYPDNTKLRSINAKLNFQLGRKNKAEIAYMDPDKSKEGRGVGPNRLPEASWDQTGRGMGYIKLEDEHIFSDNFLLSGKLAYFATGFKLTPQGGIDTQRSYDVVTGIYFDSYTYNDNWRPSYNAKLDGIYILDKALGGSHELRFGIEYRLFKSGYYGGYGGDAMKFYQDGVPYLGRVVREHDSKAWVNRYSVYLHDLYSIGRLTLSLNLRLDREHSWLDKTRIEASRVAPDLLPALDVPAIDPKIVLWTLSPRLGFTFDLTGDQKTILRGTIAKYGDHQSVYAGAISPTQLSWAQYYWDDLDGNDQISVDELIGYPYDGLISFAGFDPWDPTALESPNGIDRNLYALRTNELLLGIERELFVDFSVGITFTLRRISGYRENLFYDKEEDRVIGISDWTGPITGSLTYDGKTYDYEYFTLTSYRPAGTCLTSLPSSYDHYLGVEFTAVKRLSRGWMMNASFTYQDDPWYWADDYPGDPTNIKFLSGSNGWGISSRWMGKVNFLFQLPWGFNVSGFFNARQGWIFPEQILVSTPERAAVGLGSYTYLYTGPLDTKRLPNFYNLDLNLTKNFQIKNFGRITLSIDAFNVFNFHHTLARYSVANSSRYNEITEILNPRVIRLGLRFQL